MQPDFNPTRSGLSSTELPAPDSTRRVTGHLANSVPRSANTPPPSDGLTPAFAWRVFSQWWKLTVPLGILLASAAGAVVWYTHVPKFEGAARIRIKSQTPFIAFEVGSTESDADKYVQTQIELIRSPLVLGPVLARKDVASIQEIKVAADPVAFLQKHLSVQQVGKSELYQVSYVCPSANDAANVANAVVAEYLDMQGREDRERAKTVIDVLEKERLARGVKVEQLRKRVVELAKTLTGRDPFGQGVVMDVAGFSSATSTYQGLTDAEVSIELLKQELEVLRNAPAVASDKEGAAELLDVSNRPDVRQLEANMGDIRKQISVVKARPRQKIGESWEKDPEYIQLEEQLRLSTAELERIKKVAGERLLKQSAYERKVEQERLIEAKVLELSLVTKKRDMLASKLQERLTEFKNGGAQSAELEFAKSELERDQKVFELIAARTLALQTEMRAPDRVSLTQTADVPKIALEPIPYRLLLLICGGALVAPLGLAFGHELIIRRVSNPAQLANESSLSVLGEVARFPKRRVAASNQELPAAQQRQLLVYAESIDSLRTNLMLTGCLGTTDDAKIIAICSAASGEGKTSVATSLAMSIAEASKKPTLILDADLRAPDVSKFFDVPNYPGVAEVLSDKASLEESIHRVGTTQTYVMPAGKQRVNPHHVLQGSKIDELLGSLRSKFATIVIDTPPVLSASDSLVYAQAADLVVFCAMSDVSRANQIRLAVDRLQTTGAKLGGAVLSGVPVNRYLYRYGSYN